ncbi:lysylphosphatidylglycerol synthase transmembrane domain-containing protein [Lacticaseibacillus kribbianus]|uniref:lysylphosphatidylglycerol synthase transmembrane domain-containing protein n=1 Tax=Lacticaseibacillus kribbianus TaxID=2926292 RepID=UPI001CD7DA58|nr:lysylphosphatidylglycerol synthase transmembrane domain-containing protein [Lacticaseibacillus kribbianus]
MSRKNKLAAAVMVLLGVGIFMFEMRHLHFHQVAATLMNLNLWWLLVATLVMLGSWAIESLVVQTFVAHDGERLPFTSAARVTLVEQLFNNITPFASGGQPAQLIALMQAGVEGGRASSVLLMKFVVYQFMVLINFVLTIAIGFRQVAGRLGPLAWFIVFGFVIHVVVICGLLLVMYHYRFTKRLVAVMVGLYGRFAGPVRQATVAAKMAEKIDSFYAESLHLKREKTKVLRAAGLTLIQLLLYYSVPYFVLRSFGVDHVSLIEMMVLHVMIVMIVSLFPIPGGAGGAEYSFKTLFATYVPAASQLVLAMLLWRLLTYYLGMALGAGALSGVPAKMVRRGRDQK